MVTEELESQLRQFICDTFEMEYTSTMHITIEDNVYICILDMNQKDVPIHIGGEFNSPEDFLEYMKKELKTRRLHITKYYRLKKELDTLDELEK